MRQPGDESFIRIIDFDRSSDVYLYKFRNIFMYVLYCNSRSKLMQIERKKMGGKKKGKKKKKKKEKKNRRAATIYHALRSRFVNFYFHFCSFPHFSRFFSSPLFLSPFFFFFFFRVSMLRVMQQEEKIFAFFSSLL